MVSSATARILALLTPGTGESFYRAAGEPVGAGYDESTAADWERLKRVAEQSDSIEIVGPPQFPRDTPIHATA
jgi:hypothetical protein